jgi:hypothetical protein
MPTAIRKLGVILFVIGLLAVIGGLFPVVAGRVDEKQQQFWFAAAIIGGLLGASGLVTDWLGSQAIRDQAGSDGGSNERGEGRPPSMRLSNRPSGRGFRDDLMA